MKFTKDSINIEPAKVFSEISSKLKEDVTKKLRKRGAVVGISGGIDSSVVLAICAKTFGADHVLGVMMPENDSNPDSLELAKKLSAKFNTKYVVENMTEALAGYGCYKRRDEAIKNVFPEFNNNYKAKITLPTNLMEKESLNVFQLTIIDPAGKLKSERLPLKEYLQIVAASNFKQRSRMSMLYYHAEARNYAVIGTGNKNEHEQGFFVKYGDGGADIKPIAHLFKTQVFQLAEYLEVPDEIRKRTPTTDTYSAEQTQEEFFFRVPFGILDRVWYGWEQNVPPNEIAKALELTEENVESIIHDTQRKIRTTEYLRMEPL
ncbi:MAG: NAD(+) synthase [Ignavibacteriota bacterium]|jgi:NAD+ synthase|nr:NAD(+) synthase [Ignavibacteriales bacterium]MBL1122290.1 NAD(+) synthase [Ignavibacteriota bacterium]MCE7854924.1 NAD(+) synthase [Ignavibacteria bacterium CHB3]MEB2296211.1 NAD(+) synthase [Ignavibacteria bacterium]NUM62447.1 NAD(+) synthase [Ignavibacteriaceae bacterium]